MKNPYDVILAGRMFFQDGVLVSVDENDPCISSSVTLPCSVENIVRSAACARNQTDVGFTLAQFQRKRIRSQRNVGMYVGRLVDACRRYSCSGRIFVAGSSDQTDPLALTP